MPLIVKRPWTSQPQVAVGIDRSNPLAGRLAFAWVPQSRNPELINQVRPLTAGVTIGPGSFMLAGRGAATTTGKDIYDGTKFGGSTDYTVFTLIVDDAGRGVIRNPFDSDNSTAGYRLFQLRMDASNTLRFIAFGSGGNVQAVGTTVTSASGLSAICGRVAAGTASVWLNGGLEGSGAVPGTANTLANTGSRLSVGGYADDQTAANAFLGQVGVAFYWNRALSDAEIRKVSANPWQLFAPLPRRIWAPVASGVVTHATSGALTGDPATLSGTAAHIAVHGSTGALSGAGSTLAGTAAHIVVHSSTGALAGAGATAAGTAARLRAMATSGALLGGGATITGAAARAAAGVHDASGSLSAGGAALAGTAARIAPHATTGALAGAGATLAGTAAHVATHTTTGALVADGATLSGAAATPLKAFFGGGGFVGKPWWLRTKDDEDKPDEQPQIEAEIEAMVAEIPAVTRQNMFTDLVRNAKRARDNGAPLEDAFAAQRARTKTRQRRDAEMLLLMD